MVRKLCKTKAEVFLSSEKKRGLGKNHLGGKIGEKGKEEDQEGSGKGTFGTPSTGQ